MSDEKLLMYIDVTDLMADLDLLNTLNKDNDDMILFKRACVIGKEIGIEVPCCMCIIEIDCDEVGMIQVLRNHNFDILRDCIIELFDIIDELDIEWYDINSTTIDRRTIKALMYDTLCKDTWESSDDVHIFDDYCSRITCANNMALEIIDRHLISDDTAVVNVIAHAENMPISLNMNIKVQDALGIVIEDNMDAIQDMMESINTMCADRVSLLNMMCTQKYKEVFINDGTEITP